MHSPLTLSKFASPTVLSEQQWHECAQQHENTVRPWTTAFRRRRKRGLSHPIHDFLFIYYTAPAHQLEKWCPGFNTVLKGDSAQAFLNDTRYIQSLQGIHLDPQKLKPAERKRLPWIARLLQCADQRPPRFNCFGLHEWAMVYKADNIRHEKVPLRLTPGEIKDVLESQTVACSHYDAFRFFTASAAPRNTLQPSKENRADFEQCGCLHFNMDLYKWAYKLHPWTGSQFIRDSFFLALQARELDMQASPYDLSEYDIEPIKIETAEGRQTYQTKQQAITEQAAPLRKQLIQLCQTLRQFCSPAEEPLAR